jgi:NADPH:quinone reductase-like Zn-dependent oxidoreductase
MLAPVEALVAIPDGLDAAEAAPLLCAGVTTYNALRHSGALPGDLVAVQGIGGLGHLGLQFASKSGYRVAAIGRGSENAQIAKQLGASAYIDSPRKRPRRAHGGRGACPTPFSLVRCVSLSVTRREAADRRGPGVSQAAASRRPSAGSSGPVSALEGGVTRNAAALRAG